MAAFEQAILEPLQQLKAPAEVGQLAARNTTLNAQAGQIAHDLEADSCAS